MLIAVALIFVLALLAPAAHRVFGDYVGWALAAPVCAVAGFFGAYVPAVTGGRTFDARWDWAPQLGAAVSFHLDGLSLLMALLILGIGVLVTVYTGSYLRGHEARGVFFAWLLLFMGSMLGLILADNLVALYVFWELTTISSFLLIGFEHQRAEARAAAWQALIVTAGGGLALLAGLLMLAHVGGSYELSELRLGADAIRGDPLYEAILALVLIGAFAKSAQFPFHFWLPAAMEAPTPASAYLHSATMVKAGVYLLARMFPLLGGTDVWLWIVAPIGAVTMVLGGWLAFHARDLKQVLAFSTITMLGWMTMLLGVGTEKAIAGAVSMLLAHALYKGALFLVAGAVDHESGTRDIERLGGLRRKMPLTATAAGLAALSMAGIAPTIGFIAKETALEAMEKSARPVLGVGVVMIAGMLMVAVAAILVIRPFLGTETSDARQAHEAPQGLKAPAINIAIARAQRPTGATNAGAAP
ncbi:MAG: hypothetical protein KY475_23405 [Planctomycetes bacterium]|nr:hypothetical protein [Planctomycetota bacterium]